MIKICSNTIFISLISLLLSFECSAQKTSFSLVAQQYAGQTMRIRGFDVFHSEIIDSLAFDLQGKASGSTQYTGLALLETKDDYHFPVILGFGDLAMEINADKNVIIVNHNRENLFFYKNFRKLFSILSEKTALKESLRKFGNDDLARHLIQQKINAQDSLLAGFRNMLNDSSSYFASCLLVGKLLMDSIAVERDTSSVTRSKEILLTFLQDNLDRLRHTDLIQQISSKYMAMNDWFAFTPEQYNLHFIGDINAFISGLKKTASREEVIKQFLLMALNNYYVTPAGALVESFPADVLCSSQMKLNKVKLPLQNVSFALWGNPDNRYLLSSFQGSKVLLIFVDPDCKASIPSQVMVTRYLKEKNITIPYITVFNTSSPEKMSKWMPAIGLYCDSGIDPSLTLVAHSGIENYPAFVILDEELEVAERFYSLQEIRKYLSLLPDRE